MQIFKLLIEITLVSIVGKRGVLYGNEYIYIKYMPKYTNTYTNINTYFIFPKVSLAKEVYIYLKILSVY